MRFSEAKGHKIVSTSSADTVGKVSGFVVDPHSSSIVALRLKKTGDAGDTLPWSAVTAFGPDAVTIADVQVLVDSKAEAVAPAAADHPMIKTQVLDTTGRKLGTIRDVDFNPSDGHLVSLLLDSGEIEGSRLIGVGSYAVVVTRADSPGDSRSS